MYWMSIGCIPAEEKCIQVDPKRDYYYPARTQCELFRLAIIAFHGVPPEGARLRVKDNPHDFGTYCDVEVGADDSEPGEKYAFAVEGNTIGAWPRELFREADRLIRAQYDDGVRSASWALRDFADDPAYPAVVALLRRRGVLLPELTAA